MRIWAHRGASALRTENTLAAFERALDDGADGVELDVRSTADDVVVVAHDPTLDRVAFRRGRVLDCTARELASIDIGGGPACPGFPSLDAAIDLVVGRGRALNVEVKGDVPDKLHLARLVARLLARRAPRDLEHLVISTFRPEILVALRAHGVRVPGAFLFDREHTGPVRAAVLLELVRPDGVHPHHPLADAKAIARWKRRGWFVNAWTVDDPARIRELKDHGADGVITNDPARARAALLAGVARVST